MGTRIDVTFVVMAGGRGERLWPLVRVGRPKVCLSLDGRMSLLEATVRRLRPVWPTADWLIVTTREQAHAVSACLPSPLRRSLLVEPQVKNTAACITLAAVSLAARDPHRVMVAVPADHWIDDARAFAHSVRAAIRAAAAHDAIVTIGIRPREPHPGLGYLCAGARVTASDSVRIFRLSRFVEKPSPAVARRLIRQRGTYWNSGLFVGTADKFLECVTQWLPNHTRSLVPLTTQRADSFAERTRRAYRRLPSISFDHAVMDHLADGLIVEGRFGWVDLGSWDTWVRLRRRTDALLSLQSHGVRVVGTGRHLVATVGVRDLLVVHTPDATLICRMRQAQAVRGIVQRLSASPALRRYA